MVSYCVEIVRRGLLVICIHTEGHVPSSNGSSVVGMKLEAMCHVLHLKTYPLKEWHTFQRPIATPDFR
jgi:hypothetical protein